MHLTKYPLFVSVVRLVENSPEVAAKQSSLFVCLNTQLTCSFIAFIVLPLSGLNEAPTGRFISSLFP